SVPSCRIRSWLYYGQRPGRTRPIRVSRPSSPAAPNTKRKDLGMPEATYDLIVLGSGTGGYAAALRAAELGKRVALVERDQRLGGTCLLRGCIPSKALLESASVMDHVKRADEWGIKASGEPDWSKVLETERH